MCNTISFGVGKVLRVGYVGLTGCNALTLCRKHEVLKTCIDMRVRPATGRHAGDDEIRKARHTKNGACEVGSNRASSLFLISVEERLCS